MCLETTLRIQWVLAAMQPPSYKVFKLVRYGNAYG